MAIIKSFTDISQSKTLSEILPLESADMTYLSEESLAPKVNYYGMVFFNSKEEKPSTLIPCWSLAALFSVLPEPELIQTSEGKWLVRCWTKIRNPWSVGGYSNPIDACVAMIEKLHKLNLLDYE